MKTFRQFIREYVTDALRPHGWITPTGEYVSVTQDYQTHSELLTHVIGKEWKVDSWEDAIDMGFVRIVQHKRGFYLEYNISKLSTTAKTKTRQMVKDFYVDRLEVNAYTTSETFKKILYEDEHGLTLFLRNMK